MEIKGKKICAHGYFEYRDEKFKRLVLRKFIEAKGGIFKVGADNVDYMILGRINTNTKLTKRSKLRMLRDKNIKFIESDKFFKKLKRYDQNLFRKLNEKYKVRS